MLAKLQTYARPAQQAFLLPSTSYTSYPTMYQMQCYQFGNLQQRINRRLRRYRQDKI